MEKQSKKVYSFSLDLEQTEYLRKYSKASGISLSLLIDEAIGNLIELKKAEVEVFKKIIKMDE